MTFGMNKLMGLLDEWNQSRKTSIETTDEGAHAYMLRACRNSYEGATHVLAPLTKLE